MLQKKLGVVELCAFITAIAFVYLPHTGFAQILYEANAPITVARERASFIYQRITGQKIPIDSQILKDMETLISQGQTQQAAALATAENGFYNFTLRQFGQKLTTKASSYKTPFTDLSATIIGITKDNRDVRELLFGDYVYRSSATTGVRSDALADIARSNNHYADIETLITNNPNYDLKTSLTSQRQSIVGNNNTIVNHPDPAGIITTRAFMENCALMGTNRRCYEEIMKKFTCMTLEDFADTTASDSFVGIDVTRSPGGDPSIFRNTCNGCHGNMDSMRGAFAFVEFDAGEILHSGVRSSALFDAGGVAVKYNRGAATGFPGGYRTIDSAWVNNAVTGGVGQLFSWRDASGRVTSQPIYGSGMNSFGRMLANSGAFSKCMVKRVYSTVCRREPTLAEATFIRNVASDLEAPARGNYKMKWLFERVVSDPACIGQ